MKLPKIHPFYTMSVGIACYFIEILTVRISKINQYLACYQISCLLIGFVPQMLSATLQDKTLGG